MTCLAICKNRSGQLMMAGDRRASWDWGKAQACSRPKVRLRDGLLLGATGDGFLCSLFVDVMQIPKRGSKELDDYVYNTLYNAIHSELCGHGLADEHNVLKIPEAMGCEIIVGIKGQVYSITVENSETDKSSSQGIISIDSINVPYATGCGDGAYFVLEYIQATKGYISEKDLKEAIKTIGRLSPGCDEQVDIIKEVL